MNFLQSTALVALMVVVSLKKKSLSPSGCLGAILVGYSTFLHQYLFTTLVLLAFFVSSSLITRVRSDQKKKLEEGVTKGGQRDFIQVLCNGLTGSICSLLSIYLSYQSNSNSGTHLEQCLTSPGWPTFFLMAFIGHYACCCADTWASELGILSPDWPYLITSFQQVPPGTNGGVSLLGLLASLMGGQFIGLIAMLSIRYQEPGCGLRLGIMGLGVMAGILGSLIDSLLGATVQISYYNLKKGQIVSTLPFASPTADANDEDAIKLISGINLLDNHQVNFVSSFLTALFTGVSGHFLLTA